MLGAEVDGWVRGWATPSHSDYIVETVLAISRCAATGLKPGVNEKEQPSIVNVQFLLVEWMFVPKGAKFFSVAPIKNFRA